MAKYITEAVKKMIGMETEPVTLDVERGDIRLFAQAIGDPNPLFNDEQEARQTRFGGMIASPTFPRLLMGRQLPRPEFANPPKRLLDAGSDWEFFHPIRPGDRIKVTTRLADLRETESRLGTMLVQVIEARYVNQFDELCTIQRMTLFMY
jgi:acyl dehydratase